MDPDLPSEYPTDYDGKLKLLDLVVEKGLVKLVTYAKKMGFLEPPYGRDPEPTPYISEEQFIKTGALRKALGLATPRGDGEVVGDNDGDNDDGPEIKFSYGFCPMKFLSEYLYWAHPDAVKQRILERESACKRLMFRAAHAKRQMAAQQELQEIYRLCDSGIAWGPVISPKSDTSVLCIVQPFKAGTVVFEISETITFDVIVSTFSQITQNRVLKRARVLKSVEREAVVVATGVEDAASLPVEVERNKEEAAADEPAPGLELADEGAVEKAEEEEEEEYEYTLPVKQLIGGLLPGQLYHIRCSLQDLPGAVPDGAACFAGERHRSGSFRPLPSNEAVGSLSTFTLLGLGVHAGEMPSSLLSVDSLLSAHGGGEGYLISCLIGEVLPAVQQSSSSHDDISLRHAFYSNVWSLYRKAMSYGPDGNALLRRAPVLLSVNDCAGGAYSCLLEEEEAYKAYLAEAKRFKKKMGSVKPKKGTEPCLTLPPVGRSLASLLEALPLSQGDGLPTRGTYHTFAVGGGGALQVFVLEAKEGRVGKLQIQWLKAELRRSTALWRVVVCSSPLVYSPGLGGPATTVSSRPGTSSKIGLSLPDPSSECDEFGYLKTSLQHVMVDMYHHSGSNVHSASTGGKEGTSLDGSVGPESVRGDDATNDDTHSLGSQGGETYNDGSVVVATGVVFLTGGGWPAPYIAAFDPGHLNEAFCVEVGVGRGAYSGDVSVTESTGGTDDLALTLMYSVDRGDCTAGAGYTGSLTLLADGSMNVVIARAAEADGAAEVQVVHRAVLRSGRKSVAAATES